MYEIRAYKFRIHHDDKRQSGINKELILAKRPYNKIPERIESKYKKDKDPDINKAESAGMKIIRINSKNTANECSNIQNMQFKEYTYDLLQGMQEATAEELITPTFQ